MAFSKKSEIADMVSEKRMTFSSYTLTEILRCFSFLLNHWGGDVETDRGGGGVGGGHCFCGELFFLWSLLIM